MPWLELLLILLVLLNSLVALIGSERRGILFSNCCLCLLILLLHIFLVGAYWQVGPAYLAAVLCLLLPLTGRVARRILAIASMTLALTSCAFSIYLPIFKLPPPTGSFAIGTQIVPLINDHPQAAGAAGADGKRALMIQIWYPATSSTGRVAPYRIPEETTRLSSYQSVIPTHARWDAPIAQGPFPVLLLNPAWNGRRSYYMYLVEDLVSHGYIVAGIDHTGNSGPTAFPDGHVSKPDADPGLDSTGHTYEQMNAYGDAAQKIQVEDNRFVLDQLALWNQQAGNLYQGRLDMNRIGAFGHSFGGSVSAQLCSEDARMKAALDMDGSFWPPVQNNGLAKPLMMIEEEYEQFTPEDLKNDHADAIEYAFDQSDDRTMANSNGYRAVLHGSTHASFTDRSLYSPFRRESGLGTIPALREYSILRSYALAFFEKTLKGIDSPLLSPESKAFPEATLTILKRPVEMDSPKAAQ